LQGPGGDGEHLREGGGRDGRVPGEDGDADGRGGAETGGGGRRRGGCSGNGDDGGRGDEPEEEDVMLRVKAADQMTGRPSGPAFNDVGPMGEEGTGMPRRR